MVPYLPFESAHAQNCVQPVGTANATFLLQARHMHQAATQLAKRLLPALSVQSLLPAIHTAQALQVPLAQKNTQRHVP